MNYEKSKITCRLSLTQEIFEIFNNSSRALHIGNWRVFSLTGRECFRFEANISIPPYKALLLRSGHIVDLKRKDHIEVHWCHRSIWNNAGDVAALVDGHGNVVTIVEEGRPYNSWPTDGLHATKLDEMQLLLMLIHAGFEKELPAGRETLTKPKLVDLYEELVIPKVLSTPKRKRATAGLNLGESAAKRHKETPRPEWRPAGTPRGNQDGWLWEQPPTVKQEVDPPKDVPREDRPPWLPPGTPKQSDAWLYDPALSQSWSAPRQSGSTTPRSVPGTRMFHNLVRRLTGHGPAAGQPMEEDGPPPSEPSPSQPVPVDLRPMMLNFAAEAPGRSMSEMSIGSLPAGQSVADGSPAQPLVEEEEDEPEASAPQPPPAVVPFPLEPTLLSPEPTVLSPELAVLSPEPAVLSPEPMALSPQSTPQSGLQPNPLSPSRETFIQSQYLRRRSNVAALYPTVPHPPPTTVNYGPGGQLHPLRDTSSYIEHMPPLPSVEEPRRRVAKTSIASVVKSSAVNIARVISYLTVWLLCVAFIGWCICLVSRPSQLFCDTEKMGASRIHTDCVPCEEEGFCAQGRLWACRDKGAAREQCIQDWPAFYRHIAWEHASYRTVHALGLGAAGAAAAVRWWPRARRVGDGW